MNTPSHGLTSMRFAYAATAFLCSLPFTLWLGSLTVSSIVSMDIYEDVNLTRQTTADGVAWLSMIVGGTVVPAISAWLLWPERDRSLSNLVRRGAAVVMITMLLGPIFPLAASYGLSASPMIADISDVLKDVLGAWIFAMIFGNIFTLGLPWPVAMGVSAAFSRTQRSGT